MKNYNYVILDARNLDSIQVSATMPDLNFIIVDRRNEAKFSETERLAVDWREAELEDKLEQPFRGYNTWVGLIIQDNECRALTNNPDLSLLILDSGCSPLEYEPVYQEYLALKSEYGNYLHPVNIFN